MSNDDRSADPFARTWLTDAIVKHRHTFYIILFCLFLACFNGQWRVGRDSALYRGLGHSLATGEGYRFGEFSSHQIFPGLPVLLAGLERVFGETPLPGILLVHLFSLGCLIFTYKLIRLRYPMWVAVAVTCWVAVNSWFVELTNEIRDDIPFLCGLMIALYGWERLRIALALNPRGAPDTGQGSDLASAPSGRQRADRPVAPLLLLLLGLFIAAVMRPTFWIVAIACVMVCGIGLITGPRRRFYAICLGLLLVVWLAVALLDPRVRGFDPFAGGYERDARVALQTIGQNLGNNIVSLLEGELSYAFFGQQWFPGLTQLITLLLIGSSLLLFRTNPLWTLLILLTVAVTVVMRPVPRYFVMILPLLALAWLTLLVEIARRLPPRGYALVMIAGILTINGMNIARTAKVIKEQRGDERLVEGPKWRAISEMSRKIRDSVPPGAKVIAPDAPIVRYLSGRNAVMRRDIVPTRKAPIHWPRHIEALEPRIEYAVFPPRLYEGAETPIRQLMERGVIVPTERVAYVAAEEEPMVLAKVRIDVPEVGKDWRKRQPTTAPLTARTTVSGERRSTHEIAERRKRQQAAARREAKARREANAAKAARAERLARHERRIAAEKKAAKKRREARERRERRLQSTTAPTTAPTPSTPPQSRLDYQLDFERGRVIVGFAAGFDDRDAG